MNIEQCKDCVCCSLAKWGRKGKGNVYYCDAMGKRIEDVEECPYG